MVKKFDQDMKDRVVRLVENRILTEGLSLQKACQVVAPKLGISHHTAKAWVGKARREGRVKRSEEDTVARMAHLEQENQELRDALELLKAASAFFASELDLQRRK